MAFPRIRRRFRNSPLVERLPQLRLAAVLLGACLALPALAQEPAPPGAIHVVTVRQAITTATSMYIERAIERAAATDAECLIIRLDTPGGLLEATRDIVQILLNTRVPVVVYISPSGARGASAGTMITMAAHIAAMAPATHLGAAHPVGLFGTGDDGIMAEKVVNDTSAFIKAIAELRGRNAEWAIAAVRESKSITASEALELNVIDLIADDLSALVLAIDGREIRMDSERTIVLNTTAKPVIFQDMTFRQSFMSVLANPNLVYFLLIIGLVGLYIELSNPGLILPGVVGGISLILALIAMQTLPISYGAFGLILLGLAMLVAEAFVPSFGLLGFGGLASLLIGSLFLLDANLTDLRMSVPMVLGATASVGVVILVIGRLLFKSFRMSARSFQSTIVGQQAEVRTAIAPEAPGKVFLNGELWNATAEEPIALGERVTVEEAEGLMLHVVPAKADAALPEG